jgi:hypothetical protein
MSYEDLTAFDLLHTAIELSAMTGADRDKWTFASQKDNPPRFVRLQQVHALCKAFLPAKYVTENIQNLMDGFFSGEFINFRSIDDYAQLISRMEKAIAKTGYENGGKSELQLDHLQTNYRDLLDYKMKFGRLVGHNDGICETSYPYLYSQLLTGSISRQIKRKIRAVDAALVLFIDPEKMQLSEKELIDAYNYPTDDLGQIDEDWW